MAVLRLDARLVALALFTGLLIPATSRAQDVIAPDDPKLVAKMTDVCLSTALTSGGLDKRVRDFCRCTAPILAWHMTPDSRHRLLVENRTDLRPDYDDPNATYADVVKACPPAAP